MKKIGNILALDIGGTSIKSTHFGKVDSLTDIVISSRPTSASTGFLKIRESIYRAIENLINTSTESIAIATAGDVNPYIGKVVYATDNLPDFSGYDMKSDIEKEFGVRTYVINDAHAALIGEYEEGAAQGHNNCAMVTIGTGVGGAHMKDGFVITGNNFAAGKLGHLKLYHDGKVCNCGKYGCAEQYLSVTALLKDSGADTLNMFFQKEIYKPVIKKFQDDFCKFTEIVISEVNPDKIIVGGGMIYFSQYWFESIKNRFALLEEAVTENVAGLLGAAHFAQDSMHSGKSKYFENMK